jgi:hypothetical protein
MLGVTMGGTFRKVCNLFLLSIFFMLKGGKPLMRGRGDCECPWLKTIVFPCYAFFFYFVCEAIGTAATPGLLCQPRGIVKMIVEKQMECRLAGETEVLGEILPPRHFCPSQYPTWPDPGLNPGRRLGKPATNRLSYGAALMLCLDCAKYCTMINFT